MHDERALRASVLVSGVSKRAAHAGPTSVFKASPEHGPAAGTSLGPRADQAHGKLPHGSRAML